MGPLTDGGPGPGPKVPYGKDGTARVQILLFHDHMGYMYNIVYPFIVVGVNVVNVDIASI